jgi:hypothetical protein
MLTVSHSTPHTDTDMATLTWDGTGETAIGDLCARADIDREIGSRPPVLAAHVDSGTYDQIVADAIALAKEEIGERLLIEMTPKFRGSATLDELDELRDLILNPDTLTRPATAYAITRLYQRAADLIKVNYGADALGELPALIKIWSDEYAKRWKVAAMLLQFDLDASGDVSDDERARERKSMYRI